MKEVINAYAISTNIILMNWPIFFQINNIFVIKNSGLLMFAAYIQMHILPWAQTPLNTINPDPTAHLEKVGSILFII